MTQLTVCVVDDETDVLQSVGGLIATLPVKLQLLNTSSGYRPARDDLFRTLYILDLRVQRESGFELVERLQRIDPGFAYMVHSATATVTTAAHLMKARALEVIEKPADPAALIEAVRQGLEHVKVRADFLSKINDLNNALAPLSPREREVLFFLAVSADSKMVAERLGCSVRTVESHRLMINQKLTRPVVKRLLSSLANYLISRPIFNLPELETIDVDALATLAARTAPQSVF